MGILRFYLALCVVAAHFPGALPWGGLGGKTAVQFFFMISGFYMEFAYVKYHSPMAFYKSRILRIFPPYFLVLIASLATYLTAGCALDEWGGLRLVGEAISGGDDVVGWAALATNFTLLFQDFTLFFERTANGGVHLSFPVVQHTGNAIYHYLVIPVSWTISLELYFYLLVPSFCRTRTAILLLICCISLTLRIALFGICDLRESPWDYRFFPFELVFFIMGMLACRLSGRVVPEIFRRYGKWVPAMVACAASVVFSIHFMNHESPMSVFVLLGAGFASLPVLFHATARSKLDRIFGELSYPIYLIHMLVGWLVVGISTKLHWKTDATPFIILIMVILAGLAMCRMFIEPLERYRSRFK